MVPTLRAYTLKGAGILSPVEHGVIRHDRNRFLQTLWTPQFILDRVLQWNIYPFSRYFFKNFPKWIELLFLSNMGGQQELADYLIGTAYIVDHQRRIQLLYVHP